MLLHKQHDLPGRVSLLAKNALANLRPVYTAHRSRGHGPVEKFAEKWGQAVPGDQAAVGERLVGVRAVPGLRDVEIRKIICSTNAIESLNARCRRAVGVRGHFPNEQAPLKCLYLTTRSQDPTGHGRHDGPQGGSRP
jgi:putative transposase